MNEVMKRYAIAISSLLVFGLPVLADDVETGGSEGRLTVGGRWSDEIQEYIIDGLIPVWATGNTHVFVDLRGSAVESLAQEVNAGLVVRHLLPSSNLILGENIFYDTRWTEENNTFDQAGAGLELLGRRLDLRFNYYYPIKDPVTLSSTTETKSAVRREGDRTITTTTTHIMSRFEEALEGYDAELGLWLPFLDRTPTALYAGYYDFASEEDNVDLSGVKARLEVRLHPQLTVDAEWFEVAELNDSDYFVGLRASLPLDFWNGLRLDTPRDGVTGSPTLAARMNDMVYRDFRIRTRTTAPIEVGTVTSTTVVRRQAPPPVVKPTEPAPRRNCRLEIGQDGEPVLVCN